MNNGASVSFEDSQTPGEEETSPAFDHTASNQQHEQEGDSNDGNRPEWLPEKFKSPEEMAKAYSELEGKLGGDSSDQQQQTSNEDANNDNDKPTSKDETLQIKEKLEEQGLDFSKYEGEMLETGSLSEDSYKELLEAGYPRSLVDATVQGMQAQSERVINQVYETVGGEETYQNMVTWASEHLSDSEREAFNEVMNSPNIEQVKLAVQGLKSRYESEVGKDPNLVKGQGQRGPSSTVGYKSTEEMLRDMQDPRYRSGDKEFHRLVDQKIENSSF